MGRDLKLEQAWRERMQRYEQSGLSIKEFCRREGLVDHQFSWWRAELKRRRAKRATTVPQEAKSKSAARPRQRASISRSKTARPFVPVEVQPSPGSKGSIEIVLDQPPRIAVSSGFDAQLLREVLRVLEQR
jgi:transposase